MSRQLSSVSAFFPCYNDSGTIGNLVRLVDDVLKLVTTDYEIIVVDDGSGDDSLKVLNPTLCGSTGAESHPA